MVLGPKNLKLQGAFEILSRADVAAGGDVVGPLGKPCHFYALAPSDNPYIYIYTCICVHIYIYDYMYTYIFI